jgi:biopolymer transport protein ExbD
MSQRELENVSLPRADQIKEEEKTREKYGRTTVNVMLRDDSKPAAEFSREYLQDEKNWMVAIRGHSFSDWPSFKAQLEAEAQLDLQETPDPIAKKKLSERFVQIRADGQAPYGLVQKIIDVASQVGMFKVEVAAARPEGAP